MIPLPVLWSLVRRFWWLIPVTAILVTASVYRIQRDNARTDLAAANAAVARLEAEGRAQAEQAALSEQAWQRAAERLTGETNARLEAIAADRESLARRLFEYADRARRGEVPAVAPSPGRDDAAVGDGGSVSTVAEALDDFAARARRCDAVEEFWQRYAATVGVEVIDPR